MNAAEYVLLPLVFRKGAYGGPGSDSGRGAPARLHFLSVSMLEKRKAASMWYRSFLSSSVFALKACNRLETTQPPIATRDGQSFKISNSLKFLLSPTPIHPATPLAFCQGIWFSLIGVMVRLIFLSLSAALAAGHLFPNPHHSCLVIGSLEILVANILWRRCKITLDFQVHLSFSSLD